MYSVFNNNYFVYANNIFLSLQLDQALKMQQELRDAQKADAVSPTLQMIRHSHVFVESFMRDVPDELARMYCMEVIKLGTGLVEWWDKKNPLKPKVVAIAGTESPTPHSLSFSPHMMQQPSAARPTQQRSSWGARTPSQLRPGASAVPQQPEDVDYSFLRELGMEFGGQHMPPQ